MKVALVLLALVLIPLAADADDRALSNARFSEHIGKAEADADIKVGGDKLLLAGRFAAMAFLDWDPGFEFVKALTEDEKQRVAAAAFTARYYGFAAAGSKDVGNSMIAEATRFLKASARGFSTKSAGHVADSLKTIDAVSARKADKAVTMDWASELAAATLPLRFAEIKSPGVFGDRQKATDCVAGVAAVLIFEYHKGRNYILRLNPSAK